MAAAQIGYEEAAVAYFREALFVDLADTHGNASDGVHVASTGGVWGTIVFGFAGLFDHGTSLRFSPTLPSVWQGITFRMQRHGSRMTVDLDADGCTVTVLSGPPVPIEQVDGDTFEVVRVEPGSSIRIPRAAVPA
jgi:alpha,alpha-trehalose phosphorylase